MKAYLFIALVVWSLVVGRSAAAFEGRVTAAITRDGQATPLLYTAGTNDLRVEVTAADRPNPVNLLDLPSGEMTLLFPNNRSFVRLKAATENSATPPPGAPAPPGVGPANLPGMPAAMPMMPPPMMEKMELTATGDKTNLLGLACDRFRIKQRGETMEIWATNELFPFRPYHQNQSRRFGPQMIEETWGDLLKAKKLFPLLAILKFDNGAERYRFEVQSVAPEEIKPGDAEKLFQPPPDYQEVQSSPF